MPGLVAVTGATGFVGAHLLRALIAGDRQIRILTRRLPAALPETTPIELVLGDLDDVAALRRLVAGADAVVHVAGIIKARHAEEFDRVNVQGTRNVAAALAATAPEARVIHVSSLAAREPGLSPYAASKRGGEEAIAAVAARQALTVLRPPAVYGPGDREILPMFQAAATGILPYPAARDARLSLIHVDDLATAIVAALEARLTNPLYELDDGHAGGHAWPEIVAALTAAVGRPVRSFRLPRAPMTLVAAGAEAGRRLGGTLTALCLAKLPELYHPDWVSHGPRLEAESIWRPGFPLALGLTTTANWYRRQGWLKCPSP